MRAPSIPLASGRFNFHVEMSDRETVYIVVATDDAQVVDLVAVEADDVDGENRQPAHAFALGLARLARSVEANDDLKQAASQKAREVWSAFVYGLETEILREFGGSRKHDGVETPNARVRFLQEAPVDGTTTIAIVGLVVVPGNLPALHSPEPTVWDLWSTLWGCCKLAHHPA